MDRTKKATQPVDRFFQKVGPILFFGRSCGDRSFASRRSWLSLLGVHFRNDEWDQGHFAGSLDRLGDLSLLSRGRTGLSRRQHLAAVVRELSKKGDILIVDDFDLVEGKVADLSFAARTGLGTDVRVLVFHCGFNRKGFI